ncbi:MAG: pyridoxal 5'-phosphate synthase glutaminase subunit PdxT [Acidimicrobiales bacterium]
MNVGVLALQGAFARHARVIESLDAAATEIRLPSDLDVVDRLIIPGGESTTMSFMIDWNGLEPVLRQRIQAGMPVFGTCAGMILLSSEVLDGRTDQTPLGAIDISVRRNAFGRQIDSFETDLDITGLDAPFPAVFIRAPAVTRAGDGVEVLAKVEDQAVLCRQGSTMVAAFHPELSDDRRLHQLFLER